ncbi:fused ribosome-associated ATPase: ATP-binding protein; ATP-binding protein; putative membrane protein [Candidatus Filomicrobium marinum]|uniref:Fused ribosome-associated ATPase: ATP-binding protein ATP-binding protein putative membrane protein n=1 Tax=Candidatus Filomicrobium marinum TaxID=1608628 RepID=A0A0D6JE72_9HYPH|nr:ribosome-associated ATPase/putative transporter RbbA [Candidatus Filomicrobium marinum]CFX19127.1 fused ribosome-associated ATPase: ATP-binding protein; ATP-binding protein; putative membrane protein [Candidatus Filomicrobium marinum]CPR18469.1 fused ribosome-associated ATPase: ATP-binding protein; ATP-binding protein; putative membrane protein [Candidatus Filomicrobium marinum]
MDTGPELVARARALSHRYKKTLALDNMDIDVPAGATVGLIGPDGVGKSTLMGLIAGARKLQLGDLDVLSGNMAEAAHRNAVCPRIAYMPQGLGKNLYGDLSIAENLHFFGRLFDLSAAERKARIDRVTRATGLHPFLDRAASKLSGGMKQKLGLCCALIHEPDFLILDEPTTGVDPLSRRQFWELIASIKAERTSMSLLVSTAYMDEAEAFDWLIAINDGREIGSGTPQQLMERTGSDNLEGAYVGLLPESLNRETGKIVIPPRTVDDGEPAIRAEGLTRKFGNFVAVDNVDFTIFRGEIFGFLGSNGCGKTTTMKMLTGLLPPSSGTAFMFGEPMDASSLSMRKRVGYMSQSFSLYGELTVRQNLDLHARLFHLGTEKANARISDLVSRFGLAEHIDDLAGGLPLGLRQRLSLAVAVLHEPELLILDEPTSGVDPIARDEFWKFLIDLSRKDNVTIFISTHFMNEAMRCDRISLMHAGKVLAVGTPQELIDMRGASSLEDAFISYMEGALREGATEESVASEKVQDTSLPVIEPQGTEQSASHHSLSLGRLFAYSLRETKEVLRDPVRLAFAFIGSTILLFIFSYGITTDVDRVTFAVLDHDRSPESRAYIEEFRGSRYFREAKPLRNIQDLEARLTGNAISLALEIPPQFGRNLKRGSRPKVSAWIDGANTIRASTMSGYVSSVNDLFIKQRINETGMATAALPAEIEMRYLYNPTFESIYAIAPAVPAMLLILFPAILMAVSVVREKEIGTITNFYVTPTSRLEFLLGKQLPYIGLAMANFLIMTFVVIFIFNVPLHGSFFALAAGALIYAAAATGYGLLIATFTSSQVAAVFAAAILTMMPTMQFSGFLQPVSSLEGGARIMGTLWPTTYYMHMSVGAFTKGLGWHELLPDILTLTLFVPVFLAIAVVGLRKQEK